MSKRQYIVVGTYHAMDDSPNNDRLLAGIFEAPDEQGAVQIFDDLPYTKDVLAVASGAGSTGLNHGYWLHEVKVAVPRPRWQTTQTRLKVLGDQDA